MTHTIGPDQAKEIKDEIQPSIVERKPKSPAVIRFTDGKPTAADPDPRKERFSDGKPISGAPTVESARRYSQYTDIVHGIGQSALTPFIGESGAKAVRGGLEGLEGLITSAAAKKA